MKIIRKFPLTFGELVLISLIIAATCFGLAAPARAANVLIRNLTPTIILPAANTYLMIDGATQGTGNMLLANLPQVTSTRTTLAALDITNCSTGVTVQTLGGASIADGNASLYYYNSTSTATPNGTTVIAPGSGGGRWLIVSSSSLPAPTLSTLGGVFSHAAVTHQFLTGIGTDGTPSAGTVSNADITGLGTMSTQNASAVAITGGTASLTSLTASGGITGATLALANSGQIINGVNATTNLTNIDVGNSLGTLSMQVWSDGHARIGTTTNNQLNILVNGSEVASFTASGLNGTQIGAVTPSTGFFTQISTGTNGGNIPRLNNLTGNGFVKTSGGIGTLSVDTSTYLTTAVTSLTGTAGEISASASTGPVTLSLPTALAFTGKTVTGGTFSGGTFNSGAFNGSIGAGSPSTGLFTTFGATSGTVDLLTITTAAAIPRLGNLTTNGLIRTSGGIGTLSVDTSTYLTSAVTSLTGSTNVSVSAATGAVTVSLPTALNFSTTTVTGGTFSSGNFNGSVGAGTPAGGTFSSLTASNLSAQRTIKAGFFNVVNVKDWGAVGDGSTNDTTAIANAAAAAVSTTHVLYFPPGTYITDKISMTGVSGIEVYGDGMGVSIIKARTPSQVLSIDITSDHAVVHHLTFDGNCTTRTAGQQGVIIDAKQSSFCDNEIIHAGEFAFVTGAGAAVTDIIVSRNYVHDCFSDGLNFENVQRFTCSNNIVDGSDDDCIAVGYSGSGLASFGTITGNYCRARSDLGTAWGRGILVERSTDILIEGNYIDTVKQTGIFINNAGGSRPTRVKIIGNTVKNAATSSGHGIAVYGSTDCTLLDNVVENPASGNCVDIADWQNLNIQGNTLTQTLNVFCRGIHADEGGGWASSWDNITVAYNKINMIGAATNSCIYLNPTTGFTMNGVGVVGNLGYQVNAGDYIVVGTARTGTLAKLVNNTALKSSLTVNPSSSSGVFTVTNNN